MIYNHQLEEHNFLETSIVIRDTFNLERKSKNNSKQSHPGGNKKEEEGSMNFFKLTCE